MHALTVYLEDGPHRNGDMKPEAALDLVKKHLTLDDYAWAGGS
jgi:hypothetical protein